MTNDPMLVKITNARVKLFFKQRFLGTLIAGFELIECNETWCKTAATDGKKIFWNRTFFEKLSTEEIIFVLAHEVYHIINNHVGRRGDRNPKLWNIAIDLSINFSLYKDGLLTDVHKKPLPIMDIIHYDPKYDESLSAYEIYDLLIKEGCNDKPEFDQHLDMESGDGEEVGNPDSAPKISADDLEKHERAVKSAIVDATAVCGSSDIPKGLQRLIDELIESKMDWRSLLDSHIRSAKKANYSYQKISRRSWHNGAIFPARDKAKKLTLFAAIDTSASTTKEMSQHFTSELRGITESFEDYEIHIVSFDTEVYDHIILRPANKNDIYEYKPRGEGGTDFRAIFSMIKTLEKPVNRVVVFTDGLPNHGWGAGEHLDVLFVIHSNPQIKAPYGETISYRI